MMIIISVLGNSDYDKTGFDEPKNTTAKANIRRQKECSENKQKDVKH